VDVIELKDTPILAAAVLARVDRTVTLNTKDFTPEVAQASGLSIQTPSALIQDLRRLVDEHL
jgi:hypothetical protein